MSGSRHRDRSALNLLFDTFSMLTLSRLLHATSMAVVRTAMLVQICYTCIITAFKTHMVWARQTLVGIVILIGLVVLSPAFVLCGLALVVSAFRQERLAAEA